jgi:ATP-binding cassette subfamily A (ABC1) protein 3
MDEADILGDRIAIMADGELKACGTPFFLKKQFGVGYRLTCVKKADCDTRKLTALIGKYVANIQIDTDIGSELSYVLNERHVHVFKEMLQDLEESTEECGISSYGISLTTLDDVFMKIGTDSTVLDAKEDGLISPGGILVEDNQSGNSNSTGE